MFINNNPRIIVHKKKTITNSPLRLCFALLNHEFKETTTKNSYFKVVIWFLGSHRVASFNLKLFCWFQNRFIPIPIEGLASTFYPTHHTYFVGKISRTSFNSAGPSLTYEFSHDQIFVEKGNILVNLKPDHPTQINNELLFYDGKRSHNLLIRNLVFHQPEFYFNCHYKKLLELQIQTVDFGTDFRFFQLQEMLNSVRDAFVLQTVQLEKFELSFGKTKTPAYNFQPSITVVTHQDHYQVNLLNYLALNAANQVVETGEKQGFIFNPWLQGHQVIKLKLKIATLEADIQLPLKIPKLQLLATIKGVWHEN